MTSEAGTGRSRWSPRMWNSVADYVHSLGLDAYLVGGAVRDELLGNADRRTRTSSSPASATPGSAPRSSRTGESRTSSSPTGGSASGCRPRDREARALQPAGIEFAPPRVERSTGPGRHDFEIVADAAHLARAGHGAARLHDQRDRAAARDRRDRSIRSAAGPTSSAGSCARRSPTSFRDDPLRHRARPALRLAARRRARRGHAAADARVGAADRARLGRADRRRPRGGRDGRALEAPARARSRRRRSARARHRRARRTCCRSSTPAIGFDQREPVPATCRSTSTSSRSSRPRPTPARRWRCGSRRSCTTSASPSRLEGPDGRVHFYAKPSSASAVTRRSAELRRGARPAALPGAAPAARAPDRARAHVRRAADPRRTGRRRRFLTATATSSRSTCSPTSAADLPGKRDVPHEANVGEVEPRRFRAARWSAERAAAAPARPARGRRRTT